MCGLSSRATRRAQRRPVPALRVAVGRVAVGQSDRLNGLPKGRASALEVSLEERERVVPAALCARSKNECVERVELAGVVLHLGLRPERAQRLGEAPGVREQRVPRPDRQEEGRKGPIGRLAALEREDGIGEIEGDVPRTRAEIRLFELLERHHVDRPHLVELDSQFVMTGTRGIDVRGQEFRSQRSEIRSQLRCLLLFRIDLITRRLTSGV